MGYLRLTYKQDTVANKQDYVDLGLSCADICKALERGMDGKKLGDLSSSVCDAINQLTTWVQLATHLLSIRLLRSESQDCCKNSREGLEARRARQGLPIPSLEG